MKSHKSLTIKYLMNQKKRTLLTLVGVILSIALITGVGILFESMYFDSLQNVKKSNGYQHAMFWGMKGQELEVLKNHVKVEKVGHKTEGGIAGLSRDTFVRITCCDRDWQELMYLNLVEGRMPQEEDEIALEQWLVRDMDSKSQ